MSIPTLINYLKVKELEVRFKNTNSIIQEAAKRTANEAGYDYLSDLTIPGRQVTDKKLQTLKKEVSETLTPIWLKQFNSLTTLRKTDILRSEKKCRGLTGSVTMFPECWVNYGDGNVYQLQNGSTITGLGVQNWGVNNPAVIYFLLDTNGPYNGPNRWGYDIFLYYSQPEVNKLCDTTTKHSANQTGCYYWANKNINPKDNSTPYWKILYKPLSYWNDKS